MQTASGLIVRELREEDHPAWLCLRKQLWPDSEQEEAAHWASRSDATTLVADWTPDGVIGFLEVGMRAYADGCETSPVAFLEGWYIAPAHRRRQVGRALVRAAMEWARERGVRELASDALLENSVAHAAHLKAGFEEVERSIKYRLWLPASAGPGERP